jgi:putative transcriptional regulator
MHINKITVDNTINYIRVKFNLTQDELAKKLAVSRNLINKMENGKMDISHKTAYKINELFDVDKNSPINVAEEDEGIYIPKRLLTLLESQQRTIESQQSTIEKLSVDTTRKKTA